MRQEFHKGDRVEAWIGDGEWRIGTVRQVFRCATVPEGTRFYQYRVECDRTPSDEDETEAIFEQAEVRFPGQSKHLTLIVSKKKPVKKPRPLRAHRYIR